MDGASGAPHIPKPFSTIPSLPRNHTPRPALVEQIRSLVLSSGQDSHVTATAVNGMGGVGKTVLVTELCADKTLQQQFSDGIAWITVGRESGSNALERMKQIGHALGVQIGSEAEYRAVIREKNALIVIDDVWTSPISINSWSMTRHARA